MNKKDIALTVGGVIATMVLAYLLYRLQQRDAAAAAASAQEVAQESADQSQVAAYQVDPYAEAIASLSASSGTSNTTSAVSTSAATATTGATGTSVDDSTGINDLMENIISTYGAAIFAQGSAPETVASQTIPTISGVQSSALTGIPVTASDAANESAVPSTSYYYPLAMTTGSAVSSHPVTAHPITSTGNS